MSSSSVSILNILVLSIFFAAQCCATQEDSSNYYITWKAFSIDGVNLTQGYENSHVIVVAKDGSGDSLTVQGAVDMVPSNNKERVKIFIQPGIYRERVTVPRTKPYVSFIGKQNSQTVITGHTKASDKDSNGREIGTVYTATVNVESDYFCATEITFQNTVVEKPGMNGAQALAFKISGDKSMLYKVRFVGSQDTLLDDSGTHYFYQCHIEGAIDFIFGTAKSLYQDCTITLTAEKAGSIAAHHRESEDEDSGFSFVNCKVNGTGKEVDLGRAWGKYARTVYSYCDLDINISEQRWSDMGDESSRRTVQFGEYESSGKGAGQMGRFMRKRAKHMKHKPWVKPLSYQEAMPFLDKTFINGDKWLRV
ncbi:pectinesterase QRT1-like [Macadamia integrifolia]|uniref:pectinesterase QRT1-like n=1 Tax=Macadamia integrifolia TaxID=60698 RepID=UPI001C52AC17|nr:pectinesterase QRT1-like [Macadamia integrifolia]